MISPSFLVILLMKFHISEVRALAMLTDPPTPLPHRLIFTIASFTVVSLQEAFSGHQSPVNQQSKGWKYWKMDAFSSL